MGNKLLHNAKRVKKDDFFTQMVDIERELIHYDKVFKNKVVFCNCDIHSDSNFIKYFSRNFEKLGLTRLYGNGIISNTNTSEFNFYDKSNDTTITDIKDGDFRSEFSIEILKKSDIVVTNPPFSLFREYVEQLVKYDKKFLIIGNINAITYKEIFRLIKENKAWLGINMGRGISGFIVPEHYELYGTETSIDDFGNRIISPNNCLWLTNLDIFKRHEDINLTKTYYGNEIEYPKFDNYDAINVNKTQDIPKDYDGVMGVPITFLHKFNPDQFELIKFRKGNDDKDLSINGKCPYFRILIRKTR